MTSGELREKFLKFFQDKRHIIVSSSSLLPTDPSVLFTTAGMQQFKPYYLGKISPYGKNVVSCQKCFRTSDIEEVGDESHLTFLEMLGNFSFGGYFKEEAIKLAYEFLFEALKLPKKDAIFTIFEGDPSAGSGQSVPEDKESAEVWQKLGIPVNSIKKCGRADNFWGPTGEEGPCGPTTEIHIRGVEVWNLVFNEYYQDKNKKLTFLEQKGVDTGMGLERLAMMVQEKSNVFETDLFLSIIQKIGGGDEKAKRIIADHVKSAVFLASESVLPSNVERGYVLRRILRRAIRYGKLLNLPENFLIPLAESVIGIYQEIYPELKLKQDDILNIIQNEEEKFERTLEKGLKEISDSMPEILQDYIPGKDMKLVDFKKNAEELGKKLFFIYQTYGFPLELSFEELEKFENHSIIEKEEVIRSFQEELKKHQEISRAGVKKKFGGVGKEAGYESAKLHTATHLLHYALRNILGQEIRQMGSDIAVERLRFDFSFSRKIAEAEIRAIEDLVNQKIKEDLEIKKEEMSCEKAMESGALAFFKEKYPETVTVYSINNFSKEICAGPHADKTGELGKFKIVKEESSGAGIRRIRAILLK